MTRARDANANVCEMTNRLAVTRERPDTLRLSGRLDLCEPLVLATPDTHGRYFVLWLRDAWNTVFATLGARTTGTAARAFLLLGPGRHGGEVPADVTPIAAPSRVVQVRGSIEAVDGDATLAAGFRISPRRGITRRSDGAGWQIQGDDPIVDELALVCDTDESGAPLDGRSRYELRFTPDGAPPIDGFWSMTAFDRDLGLHSLGDLYGLRASPDGSIPVLLQRTPPARRDRSNWLPVPAAPFRIELRLYWPRAEALDGRWTPPAIHSIGVMPPSRVRPSVGAIKAHAGRAR
jgi:hypothetical protein